MNFIVFGTLSTGAHGPHFSFGIWLLVMVMRVAMVMGIEQNDSGNVDRVEEEME